MSAGHGRALLGLEGRDLQLKARDVVIRRGLSVRGTELLVRRLKSGPAAQDRIIRRKTPALVQAEEQLRRTLATKVRIIRRGQRGRIEVEFYSEDDLDRLIRKICLH
jgi:ParB family chromosome partitioning protein